MGSFRKYCLPERGRRRHRFSRSAPHAMPFPFPGMPQSRVGLAGMVPPVIAADAAMPDLGTPTRTHLRYAEELHAAIPESLKDAAPVLSAPRLDLRAPAQ